MACEDCTVVFSEEVVVDAGETQGVELVTMTTKEHIFLPCNCVQQEYMGDSVLYRGLG
jgi:hypothetical protein